MKCCSGVRLRSTSWPSASLLDRLDEVADDADVDVGLEERQPHVAQRLLDVALGDLSLALQLAPQGLELLAQGFEHDESGQRQRRGTATGGVSGLSRNVPHAQNESPRTRWPSGGSSMTRSSSDVGLYIMPPMPPMPPAAGMAGRRRLLLRLLGHHRLGGEQQARDRRGVLQRRAHDLGRVDDAGLQQVLVLLAWPR